MDKNDRNNFNIINNFNKFYTFNKFTIYIKNKQNKKLFNIRIIIYFF